jgi:hypothetical protein
MAGKDSAALLWLTSGMTTFDAYSTLNSSPWTAESFGADAARAASLREYVTHAVVFSMFYAIVGSVIILKDDGEDNRLAWYPVLGAGLANLYLVWLYMRASARGRMAGNVNWAGSST